MTFSIRYNSAASFKAECLRLPDEVAWQRRPTVVTKHGKRVAKRVPVDEEPIELLDGWPDRSRFEATSSSRSPGHNVRLPHHDLMR
jgi:hypothetical protein